MEEILYMCGREKAAFWRHTSWMNVPNSFQFHFKIKKEGKRVHPLLISNTHLFNDRQVCGRALHSGGCEMTSRTVQGEWMNSYNLTKKWWYIICVLSLQAGCSISLQISAAIMHRYMWTLEGGQDVEEKWKDQCNKILLIRKVLVLQSWTWTHRYNNVGDYHMQLSTLAHTFLLISYRLRRKKR